MPEGMGKQSWMSTGEKDAFKKMALWEEIESALAGAVAESGSNLGSLTRAVMKIVVPRIWPA